MEYDLNYFANIMSKMCGIPARLYHKGVETAFFSPVSFPKDPAKLIENQLKNHFQNIGYIYADDFFYYGYVNYKETMLLLGPTRLIKPDDAILSKMVLLLDIDKEDAIAFKSAMLSLIPLPLEGMIQALCSLNYALNHEKVDIHDVIINTAEIENISHNIQHIVIENKINENEITSEHNTFDIECDLLRMVEHGEIDQLKEWLQKAPAVRGGVLSNDALRQLKNTFIATATLESRAAIKGGLEVNEALSLSDLYIQKMELMNVYTDISSLQLAMIVDYTERVAKIRGKSNPSSFLLSVNKYVYAHISDAIKSKDICKSLYISKSVLFDKIKKETGKTVSEYILNIKINESKGLLKYSDKSISAISLYLGFSSQSHFNRTFKEIVGMSPKKYQETHRI